MSTVVRSSFESVVDSRASNYIEERGGSVQLM